MSQLIRSRYIQVFPFDDKTNICSPVIFLLNSPTQATPSAKSFRFSSRDRFSAQVKSQTLTSHFRQSKTHPKTDTTIAQPSIPHIFRKGRGADPDLFRLSFPATVEIFQSRCLRKLATVVSRPFFRPPYSAMENHSTAKAY